MIVIVDYGMGNLRSVAKGFERIGARARVSGSPDVIARAARLVLPGVGAFGDGMASLRERGLVEPILEAIADGRPFLGICLGLQLLFDVGYEDGQHTGLGVLPGKVVRFDFTGRPDARGLKIPHMGWNQIAPSPGCPLFAETPDRTYFYFVHSFHPVPLDPAVTAATCRYGYPFAAAVWRGNLFATQFHPEKSQRRGLEVLARFAAL